MFSKFSCAVKAIQRNNPVVERVTRLVLWMATRRKEGDYDPVRDVHLFRVMCLVHGMILVCFCVFYYGFFYYWTSHNDNYYHYYYSVCYPDATTAIVSTRFKRWMQKQAIYYGSNASVPIAVLLLFFDSFILIFEWYPGTSPSSCYCTAPYHKMRARRLSCLYFHCSGCFDEHVLVRHHFSLILCFFLIIPSLVLAPFAIHDRRSCTEHVQLYGVLLVSLCYIFWITLVMEPLSSNLWTLYHNILYRQFRAIVLVN